ncbi:MAG: ADOP family duplicated permease [Terriglobia bacterium]
MGPEHWIYTLPLRLRSLFHRPQVNQDLDDEIRDHLERRTADYIARGLSPEEARYAARREFGGIDQVKEECRDSWGVGLITELVQDLRYGVRMLAKTPGFTAVAVITLALGIGATTAIFTVVNAVLLRPLPYTHPEELVCVQVILNNYPVSPSAYSNDFAAWRDRSQTLSQVGAYMLSWFNLTGSGEAQRVSSGMASNSFFSLLGVRPMLGRLFLPEEDRPGGPPVVLLSEALWRSRYKADSSIVGRGITLDDKLYTVVGVLPATFVIPDHMRTEYALWVPLAEGEPGTGPIRTVRIIGRLKPGVGLEAARADLDAIAQAQLQDAIARHRWSSSFKKKIVLSPWQEQITENSRLSLLLFLGAVGFVLLIACANVANLLLSRGATRQKEISVRLTVGAARTRIVRQLLTESALLALVGGLLGLVLARWGKDLLMVFISPNLPALEPIVLDYRVLGFSLALAVVTGLAFGMVPALQASKVPLSAVLKEASHSASESRSGLLFRNLLIVCETALAMVLLVGAGLLFRSFLRVRRIDMGFMSENILSMTIDLTPSEYTTPNVQAAFFQQLMERIRGLEGVQAVGGSSCPPLGNRETSVTTALNVGGQSVEVPDARTTAVSPDYFRAMGIPLMRGRYFTEADHETSPNVAIVDESFARRYCPGGKCLGGRIVSWVRHSERLTIMGVVADARDSAEAEPHPKVYLPFSQASEPYMTVLVRTAGNPKFWASAVRSQVASVDKNQPSHDLMTLEDLQAQSRTPRRVNMLLVGTFAGLGLILATVGIYGVVSYSVIQRRHEIGVRMALGAERRDVLKIVVRQGLRSVLIGTGIGVAASIGLTRFLQTMLFGVKPTDAVTFVAVSLLLLVVAWLACYIPARRATKVDPLVALRYE